MINYIFLSMLQRVLYLIQFSWVCQMIGEHHPKLQVMFDADSCRALTHLNNWGGLINSYSSKTISRRYGFISFPFVSFLFWVELISTHLLSATFKSSSSLCTCTRAESFGLHLHLASKEYSEPSKHWESRLLMDYPLEHFVGRHESLQCLVKDWVVLGIVSLWMFSSLASGRTVITQE